MGGCGAAEGTILKTGPRHVDVVLSSAQQAGALATAAWGGWIGFSAVSYDRMRAAVGPAPNARGRDADDASAELRKVGWARPTPSSRRSAPAACTRRMNDAAARRALHDVSGGELVDAQRVRGRGRGSRRACRSSRARRARARRGPPRRCWPRPSRCGTAKASRACGPSERSARSRARCRTWPRTTCSEALLRLNVSAVREGHPAATREELRNHTLDAWGLRLGGDDYARARARRARRGAAAGAAGRGRRRRELRRRGVRRPGAVAGPRAPARPVRGFLDFGLVLVDEAAQATEPAALVPLAAAPRATRPSSWATRASSRRPSCRGTRLAPRVALPAARGDELRPRLHDAVPPHPGRMNRLKFREASTSSRGGADLPSPSRRRPPSHSAAASAARGLRLAQRRARPSRIVAVRGAESRESNADAASISNEAECAARSQGRPRAARDGRRARHRRHHALRNASAPHPRRPRGRRREVNTRARQGRKLVVSALDRAVER